MNKIRVITAVVLLFFSAIPLATSTGEVNSSDIIYVDDDAPQEWYDATHVRTIREGINIVNEGGTVFVYRGSYYENLNIDKSINLIGENRDMTTIDGSQRGNVINISNGDITVSGFTIQHSRDDYFFAGISIVSFDKRKDITISDNIFADCYMGIYVNYHLIDSNIINNIFNHNNYGGLHLFGSFSNYNSTIQHNTISGNTFDLNNGSGLMLAMANLNKIENNVFLGDGVELLWSYFNTFFNNTVNGKKLVYLEDVSNEEIEYDSGQIVLVGCSHVVVKNQDISNAHICVELFECNNCMIVNNNLSNSRFGIYLVESDNTLIGSNDFFNDIYGIMITYDKNSEISSNSIRDNNVGILPFTSSEFLIKNNDIRKNSIGVTPYHSGGQILENNIYNNEQNAWFLKITPLHDRIRWDGNYWGTSTPYPHIIWGGFFVEMKNWINIDWHPADEPYGIGGEI